MDERNAAIVAGAIRDVMNRHELGAVLQISGDTVNSYASRAPHRLPPFRIVGRRRIWFGADVLAWLNQLPLCRSSAEAKAIQRDARVEVGARDGRRPHRRTPR